MESSAKTGRPRSETTRAAILAAAFALLVERGYAGLAMEAVAQAAGAGKTTIYRWWKSKAELAVDAFFHATKDELTFPDTGTARGDFTQQITELANLLRGPRGTAMAAMLGGARTDPELAKALGDKWLNPRRQWGFARMSKAKAMGELLPDVDVGAALAVLYSPIYTPLLFSQGVPDKANVERILAIAMRGIFVNRT
jgi:AcrR family transcriptional regulator